MTELILLLTYLLAGLTGLSWSLALGGNPTVEDTVVVLLIALLPNFIGMVGLVLDRPQAEQAAHSVWGPLALAGLNFVLPVPGGWLGVGAYAGHLLVDLLTDVRGVSLLWPFSNYRAYLANASDAFGRLVILAATSLLLLLPHLTPSLSRDVSSLLNPAPTEAPILPNTVTLRVNHVYDPATEILVKPGDTISRGDLLADLSTYRQKQLAPAPATLTATPTPTFLPTSTLTPTPTASPTTTPTPGSDPLALEQAAARLQLAQIIATATAAPPDATRTFQVCDKPEQMLRQLWRDQIARDMGKAAELAWEVIHVQEIDLDILEGDIATAQAECHRFENLTYNPDTNAVTMAAAHLRLAEVEYLRALASPTPRPVSPPTVTLTPTPTRSPSPTTTPQPTITPLPPLEDDSQIYALTDGYVLDVRLAGTNGNEGQVEIVLLAANPDELAQTQQGGNRLTATISRVVDGDTVLVQINGIEETIRLIGIDTPETKHPNRPVECFGPEATTFSQNLLPPGRTVWLEFDSERRDHYGRFLAYLWLDDQTMLNDLLVSQGYARPLTIKPNNRYATHFDRLSNEAQSQGRGLWGACL